MIDKTNDVLLLVGQVLAVIMQLVMASVGIVVALTLPIMLFFQDDINAEIAAEYGESLGAFPMLPVLGMIGLGLVAIGLTFLFFGKLRAIIRSVGTGDPFVPENADRLTMMAWLLLGIELLMVPFMGFALWIAKWLEPMENADFTIGSDFDLTTVIVIVVLFILARVFKHGAQMRDDLKGTV